MGCSSSSGQAQEVSKARRRLTVGSVDGDAPASSSAGAEEPDRGLMSKLNEGTVMQLLGDKAQSRKMSIGSSQDAGRESFVNKTVQEFGDKIDPKANRLGYTCRKGLKPESPNQDSWFYLKVEDHFSLYAVFDGHGRTGHDVSQYVKDNLPKIMLMDERFKEGSDDLPELLKDSFLQIQNLVEASDKMGKLSANLSGTTATVALHDHGKNVVTVAHVADSCAILGKEKDGVWEAVQLTREHKPNLQDERARIEKAGGKVVYDGYANHRIYAGRNSRYPGLNMSRCIGDIMGHKECGMIAEPEVMQFEPTIEDKLLLLCSDGVWEFITPLEAAKLCSKFSPAEAMDAATDLAKEAWDRWIREEGGQVVDDITVVLQFLADDHHGPTVMFFVLCQDWVGFPAHPAPETWSPITRMVGTCILSVPLFLLFACSTIQELRPNGSLE